MHIAANGAVESFLLKELQRKASISSIHFLAASKEGRKIRRVLLISSAKQNKNRHFKIIDSSLRVMCIPQYGRTVNKGSETGTNNFISN